MTHKNIRLASLLAILFGAFGTNQSVGQQTLLAVLIGVSVLEAVAVSGPRAIERYKPGSDIDLCLDIASQHCLRHSNRLRLMAAIDD